MSLEYHVRICPKFFRKFVTLVSLKVPSGASPNLSRLSGIPHLSDFHFSLALPTCMYVHRYINYLPYTALPYLCVAPGPLSLPQKICIGAEGAKQEQDARNHPDGEGSHHFRVGGVPECVKVENMQYSWPSA